MKSLSAQELSLRSRALTGDAGAQYEWAAIMFARGQENEARAWLQRAAEQDHADALFTLYAAQLTGASGVARNPSAALNGVKRAAELGGVHALRLLAALHMMGFVVERDWPTACDYLMKALATNEPSAMRDVGLLLLMENPNDEIGGTLIECSARGDMLAAATAVRRALLGRAGASMKLARELSPLLERAGHPLAKRLHVAPQSGEDSKPAPEPQFDLPLISRRLQNLHPTAPPTARKISERPRIKIVEGAFTPEECDYLVGLSAPRVARTEIVDSRNDEARVDPYRTAWGFSFGPGSIEAPLVKITERLMAIAGSPFENAEQLTVLRYKVGDEYRPHHDFLADIEEDLKMRGQRVRTALIYLNDGYEGGETHFLSPDLKHRGAPGDVIVFDNVDQSGMPDVTARHASLPVRAGEKWLSSLWIRDRAYSP